MCAVRWSEIIIEGLLKLFDMRNWKIFDRKLGMIGRIQVINGMLNLYQFTQMFVKFLFFPEGIEL